MVNEGRNFFAFLAQNKPKECEILAIKEEEYDLFDSAVSRGESDSVFGLLAILRPDLMTSKTVAPPIPKLPLRFLMKEYLSTHKESENEITTSIAANNHADPSPPYENEGMNARNPLQAPSAPDNSVGYVRATSDGSDLYKNDGEEYDGYRPIDDNSPPEYRSSSRVSVAVSENSDIQRGVVMGSIVPEGNPIVQGVPLKPTGPISGSIDVSSLRKYRQLKSLSEGFDSGFLDFYRGVTFVVPPDNSDSYNVDTFISMLPMATDDELLYLMSSMAASPLFPYSLPGDTLMNDTYVSKPINEAEIYYAKKDATIRVRFASMLECLAAVVGLENYGGGFYVESMTKTSTQERVLASPILYRNVIRALQIAEEIGVPNRGLRNYFGDKADAYDCNYLSSNEPSNNAS